MAHRLVKLASLLVALCSAQAAHAQAWVGHKGGLDVELDYNLAISDTVVVAGDEDFADAGTTTQQITFGVEYTPIEKLAVGVTLPLVFLKYTGNKMIYPHPAGGKYDDGKTHATLTDLRAGGRYQVLADPVALSPHVGFSIPVADYETIGNSVAGRHLIAAHLGLSVGRVFPIGENGTAVYLHAMYEFSLVQKYDESPDTEKYGQNRSDASFVFGTKLLQGKLDLHLSANMRKTHGGVDFKDFGMFTADERNFHDAILDEEIVLGGVGVGYQLSDSLTASLAAALFISGANTQNANVFGLSFAWSPI